ncbi:MAG: YqaE/Pmp3 family membrane protein [Bacteroidota bacterium]|jgi:uncharacterized membrane protein YqaE (UPF0057 family)
MIKSKYFAFTLLLLSILSISCSFEKRLYNRGYHIDWVSKNRSVIIPTQTIEDRGGSRTSDSLSYQTLNNLPTQRENVFFKKEAKTAMSVDYDTPVYAQSAPALIATPTPMSKVINTMGPPASQTQLITADLLPKNKKLVRKFLRNTDDDQLLLVILALLLPPLSMYMYEGNRWTDKCTLNLVLTILCWVPGVVHALLTILD